MNAWWTRYLPELVREWLAGRQQLQKAIGNTFWLIFDRVVRMAGGVLIGAWVARYLGPAQFGELTYVISFIAFFQVVANLEIDGFVVRDLAQERGEPFVTLGTALWLRVVFGVLAWLGAAQVMFLLHPQDGQLLKLTLIVGATLVFQASDTVDLWFQSNSQSRRTVLAKLMAYLFSNGIKVFLLLHEASLVAIATVICLESAAGALGLAVSYRRFPTQKPWRTSAAHARALLYQCWPFIVSGIMMTTFLRIDQIMLKEMLGEQELGIFAAALPISQAWVFLPATLVSSLAPFVARRRAESEQRYEDALVKIFQIFALLALAGTTLTALASPWIIRLLYGSQYQSSAVVLSTHVFVNLLVFQGMAQYLWVINNNVEKVTMLCTFLAAVIGVCSNAILIREFGIMGAVYAILLSQVISVIVLPCLFRKDLRRLYQRAFIPFKDSYQP